MNKKYAYAFAGLLLALTACSNEDLTSPAESPVAGETVFVSLTVDRGKADTRTIINETDVENGVGLSNVWATDDQVTLVAAGGKVAGTLTLKGEGGSSEGVFSGEATVADGEYTVWYLGDARRGAPYASFNENSEFVNTLATADCSVTGDFSDLNKGDLMKSKVKIKVIDGNATVAESVNLVSQMAMAHFTLSMDGLNTALTADGAKLTLSYTVGETPYCYSITNKSADVYVPLFPGEYAPSFTLTSGEKTYTYAFANTTEVEAGVYYCGDKNATTGKSDGITVELTEEAAPEPEEDDLVGPVIPIGNKKYRFVKGNLYYDIIDKSWHLYEKETHFARLAGTSSFYNNIYTKQINGKGISDSNHLIDLFAWGATGLGDYDTPDESRAKWPDLIRQGYAGESTWAGSNWPCYNTNTNDVNGNANITDLWGSYTYTDPIYDFGYAYMQNGRPAGDNRTYVTAPLAAYAYICDQDKSFSQGCTVKGAGLNGEDVKGALIILGVTTVAEAKAKIEGVGGKVSSSFKKLNVSISNAGFDFQITLPNYESIEKLGAMFFALAGSSNWLSGKQQLSTDCGNYWTCNGATGSSTDANGYSFFFRKSSTASEFHWVVGRSGVSKTRRTQNSVRLMVEVTESDSGTSGPEFSN